MSTPASSKARLALAAIALAFVLYGALATGLSALSRWAEVEQRAYPFQQEDWLRVLLPSWGDGDAPFRIVYSGPSATRENLLEAPVEAAFPGTRVVQGALSLGTLEDVLVALEYLEAAHGRAALPDLLVLGLTPRFLADVPADRPLQPAIDRYSDAYRVRSGPVGPELEAKGFWARRIGWLRFQASKSTERYRTAMTAALLAGLEGARAHCIDRSPCPAIWPVETVEWILRQPRLAAFLYLRRPARMGLEAYLRIEISPWKYRYDPRRTDDTLRRMLQNPESFWREVYAWEPAVDADRVLARIARLRDFLEERGIELAAVNLPEHPVGRALYRPGRYEEYWALVARGFEAAPVLDLREALPAEEFYDAVHATVEGAERTTDEVIVWLRAEGLVPETPVTSHHIGRPRP